VVFESSRDWPLLYEMNRNQADHIKMAYPLKVKAIASARIKKRKGGKSANVIFQQRDDMTGDSRSAAILYPER